MGNMKQHEFIQLKFIQLKFIQVYIEEEQGGALTRPVNGNGTLGWIESSKLVLQQCQQTLGNHF